MSSRSRVCVYGDKSLAGCPGPEREEIYCNGDVSRELALF